MNPAITRREFLKSGGALVVGLSLRKPSLAQLVPAADQSLGKTLSPSEVDGFFSVHADGTVTLYCGKVDLGTGLRIAIPQMAAEELGVPIERVRMVEGDSALTPDQGPTAGSTGVMRGGVQIRQAAATARAALIRMGAERLGVSVEELEVVEGQVRPRAGGKGYSFAALIGDRQFQLPLDPKAPLKDPGTYTIVGKSLPRPDIAAKVSGRHVYMQDFKLPGMAHARVLRPASVGARLLAVDESSISAIPRTRVVHINNFLAVVAEDEWDAVLAARALKVRWEATSTLIGHEAVEGWMRAGPFESDQVLQKTGDAQGVLASAPKRLAGTYYWPMQSHASMGPSCAVADVRDGEATVWSASQATHRLSRTLARLLGLSPSAVRVVYLDGAGCYGMNGHDDAAAEAVLLSKAVGRPVRVQWTREDELGWDPKGPPQLLAFEAALDAQGKISAWRTEMWLPRATAKLPNPPLLSLDAAGVKQTPGFTTGLIFQNGAPAFPLANVDVTVHWLKDAPLRPSNLRAPGKIGNNFAVESFVDELAAAAQRDPLEFRMEAVKDPRGMEVLKRAAALIGWKSRPSPGKGNVGRGIAYIHYKNNENYVAIAMEAQVDRATGSIRVQRVACAHDCGLMINPDAVRQQIEGNIYQTLSRTLLEEVKFDRARVTSVDWGSYPILAFPEAPEILIDLVERPRDPPLGVGEAASAPVPAALGNAIFDATGVRLRKVPFTRERFKAAAAETSRQIGPA